MCTLMLVFSTMHIHRLWIVKIYEVSINLVLISIHSIFHESL
jgi:hypothetical protein